MQIYVYNKRCKMLSITLNVIGIVLIIYSVYIIKKDFLRERIKFEESNIVKETMENNHNSTSKITSDFNKLIDYKIKETNYEAKRDIDLPEMKNISDSNLNTNDIEVNKEINPMYEKVIDLLKIGLTKEEIAKKTNKGIREVEIIIKMYKK